MRAEIAKCAQRYLSVHRDSTFCAKSVRYNIFTNGAPYLTFNYDYRNQSLRNRLRCASMSDSASKSRENQSALTTVTACMRGKQCVTDDK